MSAGRGQWTAEWETVIGLEVHCELETATKLFCGCRNAFGDEPNTNVCPVCLGLPGSLPVLNEQAVELAMRIGAALHCEIRPSEFARKNYFYPDQAKDYQISQYDEPLNTGGWLELPDGSAVGVTRAHMEEDTGKSTHVGASGPYQRRPARAGRLQPLRRAAGGDRERTRHSLRRPGAGVCVGAPRDPDGDGRVRRPDGGGSIRVDANVSVHPAGTSEFGTRCEIKNLNSLRSLGRAIEYEAARQIALLEAGGKVDQETRHWDESAGRTESMRSKEEANDYRYFPEPDLVPLAPDAAWRERVRVGMGPMPSDRRAQLAAALGGAPTDAEADQIRAVVDLGLDGLVTTVAEAGLPASLALARAANEVAAQSEAGLGLSAPTFVALLAMESGRTVVGDAVQGRVGGAARARRGRPGGRGQGDGVRGPRSGHAVGRGRRRDRGAPW